MLARKWLFALLFGLSGTLAQSTLNIVEIHLLVGTTGSYLITSAGAGNDEVTIIGPSGSYRVSLSFDTKLELPFGTVASAPPEGIRWLYDGRWFSYQEGYWMLAELELQLATPFEEQILDSKIAALNLPKPLLVVEAPGKQTLSPLTYEPAPLGILYTTVWVDPAPAGSGEIRLLANAQPKVGGLRSRGNWLQNQAELNALWGKLGLGPPPPADFSRRVGFYFTGIRAESRYRLEIEQTRLEQGRLSVVLRPSHSPTLTAETNGVVLLFELPPSIHSLRLIETGGRVLGEF